MTTNLDQAILTALAAMPLSTTRDLGQATSRTPSTIRNRLTALTEEGRVHHSMVGSPMGAIHRWWLAPENFALGHVPTHFHNTRRGMGMLLNRITAVERIYQMASDLQLIHPGSTFRWHTHRSYDAIAGSPDQWTALFWSGIWEDAPAIRRRIRRLAPDIHGQWPSLLAFAVPDHWQAQVLSSVLHEMHLDGDSAILVAQDDSWTHHPEPTHSRHPRGWPEPPELHPPPQPSSSDRLRHFIADNRFEGTPGSMIQKILPILEQWPGLLASHIRKLLANQSTGSQITDALGHMQALDLASHHDRAWYPGPAAWTRASHRDRVPHRRTTGRMGRSDPDQGRRRLRRHDWAVTAIAASFHCTGSPIAPGWRAIVDAGPAGKIDPDAVVYLHQGPYGPGWHYLEFERRAHKPSLIPAKLRSYRMEQRDNDWPVMFILQSDAVQRRYWEHGRGIKLITAVSTQRDIPKNWNCFGTPVQIA